MMEQGQERREFTRVPFATKTIIRADGQEFRSSSTLDISLNGLRVSSTEAAPREDAVCDVEILLAGSEPPVVIAGRGTIVRSTPGTLAVHFIEIDLDSYHHLQQIILNNAEHPERIEQEIRSRPGIRRPAS